MSGSISSTYESKANPIAAVAQIAHCMAVKRGGVAAVVITIVCEP
jgi:hypothetical protein